jgi:hypothetical protein
MSKTLTGQQALQEIDRSIARLRRRVSDAVKESELAHRRAAEVRDEQVMAYRKLADIRLQVLSEDEATELDALHKQAVSLLAEHDAYVFAAEENVTTAREHLDTLEASRLEQSEGLATAIEAYEALVGRVQEKLAKDPDYQSLVSDFDQAEAVVKRAGEKLAIAKEEMLEKGEPYREDALFLYLWQRGFRTTNYEGGGLFRMLDGWVAKLCNYDDARANYKRLNDLPEWLEEHLEEEERNLQQARQTLETAEQDALDQAGAGEASAGIAKIRQQLSHLDTQIEQAEKDYADKIAEYEQSRAGDSKPALKARDLLEAGLRGAAFADLRELAAETTTQQDDELVDHLVALRTEELDLEVTQEQDTERPRRLQQDLVELEQLRRGFKATRMDSGYAQFKLSVFNEALADLSRGLSGADAVLRRLKRGMVRREPKTEYGFGGERRQDTLGLPTILGGIGREILREVERELRHSSDGSYDRRYRGRPTRFPKSRSGSKRSRKGKGGGFRTGGGF